MHGVVRVAEPAIASYQLACNVKIDTLQVGHKQIAFSAQVLIGQ